MFQFTRARGARHNGIVGDSTPEGFNSRAHGARDSIAFGYYLTEDNVSIHARTGRATPSESARMSTMTVSIHARTGRAT